MAVAAFFGLLHVAGWVVLLPVGVLFVATVIVFCRLLRRLSPARALSRVS